MVNIISSEWKRINIIDDLQFSEESWREIKTNCIFVWMNNETKRNIVDFLWSEYFVDLSFHNGHHYPDLNKKN